jgi:predicted nucleic acid-binding protein
MERLKLPASGTVYLDSNSVIYTVERLEPYAELLDPLWHAVAAHQFGVVSSVLVLLEVLVKPLRAGDALLEEVYRDLLLDSAEYGLVSLDQDIAESAARIRAQHGLQTADAIHAATALEQHVDLFVTNDPAFVRVPGLPVALLSECVNGA